MNRLLACLIALFASACAIETGSGHLVDENVNVPAFTAIELHDGFQADVSVGYDQQVMLIADDNLMHHIRTSVSGQRLVVETDGTIVIDGTLRVRISVPALYGVDLSGGSNAVAAGISADSVNVSLSGGSEAELIGNCGSLRASASGGSKLHARSLPCDSANLDLSGGSEAQVTVSHDLRVDASGGSEVTVSGHPYISDNLSGGSDLIFE